jgi:hypothetical protein
MRQFLIFNRAKDDLVKRVNSSDKLSYSFRNA